MRQNVQVVRLAPDGGPTVPFEDLKGGLPRDIEGALNTAKRLTPLSARLGRGGTLRLWETLATLGSHDLGIARAVEPHLDAAAILEQAGRAEPEGAWGVYAAEGGPDPLRAEASGGGWSVTGTKRWCSLADRLDSALVTAQTAEGEPRLFAVDLTRPEVRATEGTWHARGLAEIPSGPVVFTGAPAAPVGEAGWYLSRSGFWWGSIGVAACWYGGAVGIARTVFASTSSGMGPHALAHLGAIDSLLHACRLALADAASHVDDSSYAEGRLLAKRVRGVVADACEEIITRAGHATGPGPLTTDLHHAKQVSDLSIYIRQYHAERDQASQGSILAGLGGPPW